MSTPPPHLGSVFVRSMFARSVFVRVLLSIGLCVLAGRALVGCTPTLEYGATLSDEGILALSTTNAYLGSNLFLAREAERSQFLFNFLKGRGAPSAIKIKERALDNPTITLYYTRDKEQFIAELQERDDLGAKIFRQWIVRGPFAISRSDYRELARLDDGGKGAPLFQIYGKPYRFVPDREKVERVIEPIVPPVPTTPPRPRITKSAPEHPQPEKTPLPPAHFTPLNTDQLAILMSEGYAERASNGDVIHTVKSESETLAQIAKWYTGNASNTTALLEVNDLKTPEALPVGARVRIPMRLVREFKAMK